MPTELAKKIADRTALVGVVGLGYVGLPLIRAFVDAGFRTLGFDVDDAKVTQLRDGRSYIGHISASWIRDCVGQGKLVPTTDMGRLAEPDAILICVPTPLSESRDPDISYIRSTTEHIAAALRPGQLIVLESTTYPGTTRDVMLPILSGGGRLTLGRDFYLAYSPEREDPGNPDLTARNIPKVVGGCDEESCRHAADLYRSTVVDVVTVSSCEAAEACKILENTYRAVNIALVNELKRLFQEIGIDVWEVIEAAKTKPFGFQAFYPGPGLGGHCIPIDPFYLSWLARMHGLPTRFIELAGEINTAMPRYVIQRLTMALNHVAKPVQGSRVCVLGVAYKKDVDDPRESPSFTLLEELQSLGAHISYNDPFVPVLPRVRHSRVPRMESAELTAEFLGQQDCVLIATDHSSYDYPWIVEQSQLVVDTRNATAGVRANREKIWKA